MGRAPCCEKVGLKRGPWQPEEDEKLIAYIQKHGHENWRALPQKAGLKRCGKSCRLRWTNYLRPDIKRGGFSIEEDNMIIQLHSILGNRWSVIAAHMPGRTDNEIKNYWNTHLRKQLLQMGIDPVTHRMKNEMSDSTVSSPNSVLNQMALWERARMQAESRLAREYLNFISRNQNNKKNEHVFAEWLEKHLKSSGKYLDTDNNITVSPSYTDTAPNNQFDNYGGYWVQENPSYQFQTGIDFGTSSEGSSEGSLPHLTDHDVHFTGVLQQQEVYAIVNQEDTTIPSKESQIMLSPAFEIGPLDQQVYGPFDQMYTREGVDMLDFTHTDSIPNNSEYWSTILKIVGT